MTYEPAIVSIGNDPDGRFISIGVVTEEQAKSEELPSVIAIYDVPRLSQLILTLHSHLNGMIAAATPEADDAHSGDE